MASGHVNRTQRPNTWLHRPSLRREDFLANLEPSTLPTEAAHGGHSSACVCWAGAFSRKGSTTCSLLSFKTN